LADGILSCRIKVLHSHADGLGDPKLTEAHLWLGLALRKSNKNPEARKEFQKVVELNPARVWTKQQPEKTPAQ